VTGSPAGGNASPKCEPAPTGPRCLPAPGALLFAGGPFRTAGYNKETTMAWTTPTLVEICIGLEINGYLPAEF
jgi:coenzyme PQQ precursor peptide PqqA